MSRVQLKNVATLEQNVIDIRMYLLLAYLLICDNFPKLMKLSTLITS